MVIASAWQKNNRRELRKTLGRFFAMVSIIALGVGFFMGLKSARPTMAETCNQYLNESNFYDIQLISSLGFDLDAPEDYRELSGIQAAEGSLSSDLLALVHEKETVFKAHLLLPSINQVKLTAGRMPEAANEVLADDLVFQADSLETELTVMHQEDSLFSQDTYIIVGLVNSPQYLNLSRGTTSLGNGTVEGFLFLTRDGFEADYYTELYLRLDNGSLRDSFAPGYTDSLEDWEDPLMKILEPQGQRRLDSILEEAEQELNDGWIEYYDGLAEFSSTKTKVERELKDAAEQLEDAKQQLEDGRKELEEGEETLAQLIDNPYSNAMIADAKAQLEQGRQELEDGIRQYEEGLAQYEAMEGPVNLLLSAARKALNEACNSLTAAQTAYDQAKAAFDQAEAEIRAQQEVLYTPVQQLEQELQAAEANTAAKQAALEQLQNSGADPTEILAASAELEVARIDAASKRAAYETAKAAYDTQAALLEAQLEVSRQQLALAQTTLDEAQARVDSLSQQIESYEKQLSDAETQLLDAEIQIEEGRRQLEEGEATLQREIANAISTARSQLDEGWAELEDGEKEYADGLKEYEDGKAEAETEFADAQKELDSAYRDLKQATLDLERMKDPSYFVLTPTSNNGYLSFDNDTNIVEGLAKLFPLFFFLVAALVCSSTMTRMVEEQRTQNGTLKALGYSDGKILSRYAVYAGSAAVIGFGIGLLVGTFVFPYVIWEAYKSLYHFGELTYVFNWGMAVISLAASLLCSVGAACLAAWSDLRQMPAQLMRPKTPKAGKRILLEYIKPLWNHLSFLAKVSLRNIFRYKKRLFMMILGTGGCLALLLAGLGLRDSIANVADDQFGEITMYDYSITFSERQTDEEQSAFRETFANQLDQCVFVGASTLEVPTNRGTKAVTVVACSDPAIDDLLGLIWEEQDLGYPTGNGMYVSHALAEDAGLQVGDLLPIQLESNDLIEIPITGIFTNYVSHYVYLTEEGYGKWFGIAPEIKTAYATTEHEDLYSVGAELQGHEDVINLMVSQDLKDTVGNVMTSLNAIILLVVGCATALAFVVGYNLININITERVREIATIKVLGFYRKETHTYVFRESIILTILGTVVGVPLGVWLHGFIMESVKVDFVCFQTQIAPVSYVIGIAVTILVTVIVDRLLSKKIDAINMAESLKSVE